MKKYFARISLVIFTIVGVLAHADDSSQNSENKLAEIRKLCARDKKPRDVCGCRVKNLSIKFKNDQFSEKQLSDAVLVAKHSSDAPDYVADLMTGIEYHCMENSNYTAD
ncbi:MAG: hypothetical protein ACXVA9_04920 [Bdellovibrionales bacterium]